MQGYRINLAGLEPLAGARDSRKATVKIRRNTDNVFIRLYPKFLAPIYLKPLLLIEYIFDYKVKLYTFDFNLFYKKNINEIS